MRSSKGGQSVDADPEANKIESALRERQRARGGGEVAEFGPKSSLLRLRDRGLEASQLFGVLVSSRVGQVAPETAYRQPALALVFGGAAKELARQGLLDTVTRKPGVDLELHESVSGDLGRPIELRQRADAEIDAGIHCGLEV